MDTEARKFWENRQKGEKLGQILTGYARVMFVEEAEYMLQEGKSLSEEWFEVWDGLLPPIVYGLIDAKTGKKARYERVLFIDQQTEEQSGITSIQQHPNYNKYYPAIFLSKKIELTGVDPSRIVDLSQLVKERIASLPPRDPSKMVGWWTYARIALEPVPTPRSV